MIGRTNKNISELFDLESSLLSEQEKALLKDTGEKLDSKTKEMRRKILGETAPIVNEIASNRENNGKGGQYKIQQQDIECNSGGHTGILYC